MSPQNALRNLMRVAFAHDTRSRLWHKLKHDRLLMRSSALAFETLLSIVPLIAVSMGAVRMVGGAELEAFLLRFLAEEYVPASAGPGVNHFLSLVRGLNLSTVGLFGLLALIPVMFSLVDAVELALADIFRAPRRTHWWRLLILGGLLTLAPLGSVLTVRYVPWSSLGYDHLITPVLVISGLLYAVFRGLPKVVISDRAALSGALTAGLLLALAKVGFGLYTTHLGSSLHLVWGAVAFVPLLLLWVLLSWSIVLFGAELTSVLQYQLTALEQPLAQRRRASLPRRQRIRRRIVKKRRRDTEPPEALAALPGDGPGRTAAAPPEPEPLAEPRRARTNAPH